MPTFERCGILWSNKDPLDVEFRFIRNGGYLIVEGQRYGLGLLEHYLAARRLLWPERSENRWTRLIYEEIIKNTITILMGAASCVAGHTKLLNPITGEETEISELYRKRIRPMVMTLKGPILAHVPFIKGYTELFEVVMENGKRFTASPEHRVLSSEGFLTVASLRVGQQLLAYDEFPQSSNSDIFRLALSSNALRYIQKAQDSQCDCQRDYRFDDARLLPEVAIGPDIVPLPTCARTHHVNTLTDLDDRETRRGYNHQRLSFVPPSSCNALVPVCNKETFSKPYTFSGMSPHDDDWFSLSWPCELTKPRILPCSTPVHDSPHSSMVDEMPCKQYRVQHIRVASIKSVGSDYFYDLEVPGPRHYFAEGTIHHNTGKTATASEWVLIDYFIHPKNTLALVTTTTVDKLESNVFGEIKSLWSNAKDRFPWLAGNIVDHQHAIYTDELGTDKIRDRRQGILGRACYESKQWVGDAVFVGIKQQRVRFIGDELSYMALTFLRSWNPLFSNPDVKIIGSGNPNHNPDDPLGVAAEPKDGWNSLREPDKTICWQTKHLDGRCVNLVGTDSPNFDVPEGQPEPYPFLIGRKFMRRVIHDSGPESPDFYRLVKGVMKFSLAHDRVITRQLCLDHGAYSKAIWKTNEKTKIYAIDPSYGGGDRCMRGYVEFGESLEGKQILRFTQPTEIQINLKLAASPEDQIANAVWDDLQRYDIPPENCFYGAFGKGTIGFAFARKFGNNSPVPIDEGGLATKRPVRMDLHIFDEVKKEMRLKRCDEHYSKKITELWFSWRYAIEANQVRELTEDVVAEGCMREYYTVAGNRIEVEPKADMKERLSRSPDKADWAAFCIEGARQRGFSIDKLGPVSESNDNDVDFFDREAKEYRETIESKLLVH